MSAMTETQEKAVRNLVDIMTEERAEKHAAILSKQMYHVNGLTLALLESMKDGDGIAEPLDDVRLAEAVGMIRAMRMAYEATWWATPGKTATPSDAT